MDALAVPPFSALDFRQRAARRLALAAPGEDVHGDHRLNPDIRHLIVRDRLPAAAVLVPVVDHPGEAGLLLTTRTEGLRRHSGQVAFPGGRIDADDASPEAAALREAQEEIGLSPLDVEVIGRMPDYFAGSGYRITPVLSIVRPGARLSLNPAEVGDVFEVPLSFVMDAANHRRDSRMLADAERHFYAMPWDGRLIWGVTAGIIRALHDRLYG